MHIFTVFGAVELQLSGFVLACPTLRLGGQPLARPLAVNN